MIRQRVLYKYFFHNYLVIHPNLTKISICTKSSQNTMDTKFLSELKSNLKDIFRSAVKAVSPNEIIKKKVKLKNNNLCINGESIPLRQNVYLIGFGKAVMGMAIELEKILGSSLKKGIISIPSKSMDAIWSWDDKSSFPKLHNSMIEYREGSINNQPDNRSLNTTHDIIDLVEKLTETDTLIVLVSGGGSALLYMPRPIIDQEDKLELCKALQNAGADITELNTVRKKLSLVKGGGLARMAYPASVITLILSDIVGDPIDLIASGPTIYSSKAPEGVIAILKKYNLYQSLEGDLKTAVTSKEFFDDSKLLNLAKQFKHVTNIIVGNNTMALEAASLEAWRKTFIPVVLGNNVKGNVQHVSLAYVHITSLICLVLLNDLKIEKFYDEVRTIPMFPLSFDKVKEIYHHIINSLGGILLIGGGEPTVEVTGQGKGGRNQELALRFSLDWLAKIKSYPRFVDYDVIMLSAGTDGQDGPTDAAGAFGYPAIPPIIHDLYAKVNRMVSDAKSSTSNASCEPKMSTSVAKQERKTQYGSSDNITAESVSAREDIKDRIDSLMLIAMEVQRMLPENTLKDNDTYNFYSRFKKGVDLVKTGLTGTNVMDLHFIYIKRRLCKHESDASDKPECEDILDVHDLHVDATTIEKYKATRSTSVSFKYDESLHDLDSIAKAKEEKSFLNIKIIDESLTDSCCSKKHKLT